MNGANCHSPLRLVMISRLFGVMVFAAAVWAAGGGLVDAAWSQAARAAPESSEDVHTIAPGLVYRHLRRETPQGEPWSIHLLEMSRKEKKLELRSVRGRGPEGEMARERPTEMARREIAAGAEVLAVVNGDFDLAAPYLGISTGTSVSGGIVATTGDLTRPVFAVRKNGEPRIGFPLVRIEARAGKETWTFGALNKPLGSSHSTSFEPEPERAFTRDFRPEIKSGTPFCAVTLRGFSPPLPLRVNTRTTGRVARVEATARHVTMSAQELVLTQPGSVFPESRGLCAALRPGQRVAIRVEVSVQGRKDLREVVGGYPFLVVQGRRNFFRASPGANLRLRHPRTALCYNREKIIFVVVDGRQPQRSVGMTLEELGDLMVELGCETAMNTDGGGSSVMAVKTEVGGSRLAAGELRIVNSPSDGPERGRGNAWLIVRRK
jgi:hypothetical protein